MLIVYIGLLPYQGKTGFQNEDTALMFFRCLFTEKPAFFKDPIVICEI